MSFLEEKIKDNRAFFDDKEPGLGHKGRFLGKLDHHEVPETRLGRWFAMMKIAAIALLFITASYFIFKFSFQD
nr:hypothetical protein [Bacteroidota bacterium]